MAVNHIALETSKLIKNYHASEEIKGFYVQRDNFYDRHPATGIMNFDENGKLVSVTFQEHEGGSLVQLGRTIVYDLKGNILKELSKEQTKEIRSYRGNMAININNILRNDGENNEFWKPYIDIMDSLFKSDKIYSRTTKPMTVYRGIDINQRLWNILEDGNIFLEKGYMSTSRDKDIAKRNGNYLLEIEIPKGTK